MSIKKTKTTDQKKKHLGFLSGLFKNRNIPWEENTVLRFKTWDIRIIPVDYLICISLYWHFRAIARFENIDKNQRAGCFRNIFKG